MSTIEQRFSEELFAIRKAGFFDSKEWQVPGNDEWDVRLDLWNAMRGADISDSVGHPPDHFDFIVSFRSQRTREKIDVVLNYQYNGKLSVLFRLREVTTRYNGRSVAHLLDPAIGLLPLETYLAPFLLEQEAIGKEKRLLRRKEWPRTVFKRALGLFQKDAPRQAPARGVRRS